jgi:hypothetical protein
VTGDTGFSQLFYGAAEDPMRAFDVREVPQRVVVDISPAHIWDISSAQALDMAVLKVPPRRGGGRDHGHERGLRDADGPAGRAGQAGRGRPADGTLREETA